MNFSCVSEPTLTLCRATGFYLLEHWKRDDVAIKQIFRATITDRPDHPFGLKLAIFAGVQHLVRCRNLDVVVKEMLWKTFGANLEKHSRATNISSLENLLTILCMDLKDQQEKRAKLVGEEIFAFKIRSCGKLNIL